MYAHKATTTDDHRGLYIPAHPRSYERKTLLLKPAGGTFSFGLANFQAHLSFLRLKKPHFFLQESGKIIFFPNSSYNTHAENTFLLRA